MNKTLNIDLSSFSNFLCSVALSVRKLDHHFLVCTIFYVFIPFMIFQTKTPAQWESTENKTIPKSPPCQGGAGL